MVETLLGTLFGGIFRLAPEALKLWERKDERKHELAMLDKNIEADTLKATAGEKLAAIEANKAVGIAEINALIEGAKAQSAQTGIKWIDGFNSLMRPLLTFYWCILMYSVALWAQYAVLMATGIATSEAVMALWGPQEKAIVASMFSYWFLDRTLRKM